MALEPVGPGRMAACIHSEELAALAEGASLG